MRNTALLAATAAIALAAPAAAQDHGDMDHANMDHSAHAEHMAMENALNIDTILMHPRRADDRARDQYRRPAETLAFFQIDPTMRVAEFGPGGGWYTRVLMPYLAPQGHYMAFQGAGRPADDGTTWSQRFLAASQGWGEGGHVMAFETDAVPEEVTGTVDRVLIFRSLHGLLNSESADTQLRAMHSMLAEDGLVGVVQHRAPEGASYADSNGSRGYLRQSDVIRLFELNGFELHAQSEVNANPNDTADWEGGVWTLPPTLRFGDQDRARYEAIGESDRMTLLFRKRA